MKSASLGLITAMCVAGTGLAHASTGGDMPKLAPRGPAAAAPSRPGMFAAAAAPFARRFTAEQREESRFLKDSLATSRFTHEAARMALAKSGDAKVRTLAATLVNHYGATQVSLQHMLHSRNMAPPMLANDQRRTLNRLAKIQGTKFDREWMESVALRAQQDDVAAFERAIGTIRDPQVRAFIERTLPAMRYQLASAGMRSPALATRAMGAPAALKNPSDLSEGNMVLGPARPVAALAR